jgi:hypothetical protein
MGFRKVLIPPKLQIPQDLYALIGRYLFNCFLFSSRADYYRRRTENCSQSARTLTNTATAFNLCGASPLVFFRY